MRKLLPILAMLLITSTGYAQDNLLARRPVGQHTVTFSATPVFDAGVTNSFKITLTGNVTSSTLLSVEAGEFIIIEVCQDGVGGRTFVPPAQFVGWVSIPAGINACITELAHYDGTSANVVTTQTGGGGGSGTVNSGTVNRIAIYSGATTVSSDSTLDDGLTTANTLTYTGSGGIVASQFTTNTGGAWVLDGTNGACGSGLASHTRICLGDSLAGTFKISNNGGTFLTALQYSNDSPTPYAPLCADTVFPHAITVPIGSVGQPLISQGSAACFAYGALDVSSSANVVNRIQKANIVTSAVFNDQVNTATTAFTLDLSASTAANPFRIANIAGFSTTTNGSLGYNTTTNNFVGGMNSGNAIFPVTTVTPINGNCMKWVVTSGNFQAGDAGSACGGGGGSPPLNNIIAATGTTTIDNANFSQIWRWQLTSAGAKAFRWTETAASTSTGTPYLFAIDTVATSTLNPFIVTAGGTSNGWNVTTAALLAPLGTGAIAIPGTSGQIILSKGATIATSAIDLPDVKVIPLAACNNSGTPSAGNAVDTPSSGGFTPACVGTTTVKGALQGIPSTGAVFSFTGFSLSKDWDTTSQPFIEVDYGSGTNASGTVIWTVSTGCAKIDGSVSDDPALNAEAAMATQTMAVASREWGQSMQLTTLTSGNNCIGGSPITIKVALSGTAAANINAYRVRITQPRLPVVQAN